MLNLDTLLNYLSIDPNLIWYIVVSPLVFIRVWTILFVAKDISHRTNNLFYQLICILLVALLSPFVWFPLYFIIRPYKTLDDLMWKQVIESFAIRCEDCGEVNHHNNKYCVSCWDYITIECKECKQRHDQTFEYCSNCWAPANLEAR